MNSNGQSILSQNGATHSVLQMPEIVLPVRGNSPARPSLELLEGLKEVSSATASAKLHLLGIRQTFIQGPTSRLSGTRIVGPAITLQFMPQREDIASGQAQEDVEKHSALWAVLEEVQPGDVMVVQAYADPYTGCFGEMLLSYFQKRGGQGLVVDGYIRDWPHVQKLNLPIWACGFTPNYASQSGLFPWAYNVPVACSRVLVLPGDIIIADDDGAVLVPIKLAPLILEQTLAHEEWETFSRMKLAQGGALSKYYPLNEEARLEYKEWRELQLAGDVKHTKA